MDVSREFKMEFCNEKRAGAYPALFDLSIFAKY
jgi:hypothetical protein